MWRKILIYLKETIQEEYKFIIILFLLFIILQYPINYYIIVGGGTSDVSSRIEVNEKYKSKGSFNISFVTELKGTPATYILSYIVPTWDRESADLFKYSKKESIEDIEFRSDLDLRCANQTAKYWAYTLANKDVELINSNLYVITIFEEYDTPLKIGDEILSIDGNHFNTIDEYRNYLQDKTKDDEVTIRVTRKDKEKELKVPLYEYKNSIIMGVALQYYRNYKTNPSVDIHFKRSESGPSGGLITTLEIYNQLTKKDITNGLKIAGTGTIEEDGTIGQIGGIEYKLFGAASDKADVFLAPSGENYKEALKYKKKKNLKIKLIEVKSIQDALKKLEKLK